MRPRSVFVRKSPIPSYINKHVSKPSLASPTSDSLINNVEGLDFTVKKVSNDEGLDSLVERSSSDAKASRPKSAFSRKSPIVKVNQLSRRTKNTEQQSLLRHKDSSENKSTVLLGGNMNDESCHNGVLELEKCKLTELKSIAKNRGLRGYSRLKKAELLALLKELDA
ncbi:hypothetical protein KP509_25G063000 [Ceratopteris richardii]|nr:hypothetical protein KP509_25G063000 [Ceratopteris richardii]